MSVRRAAVVLLAVEAALGLAWWTMLLARPDLGSVFLPQGVPAELIRTFVLADFVFFAAAPAIAAVGVARSRPWALPALWLHAGAVTYAALWGWGTVLVTGEGLLGALLMTPPAIVMPWLAWRLAATQPTGPA